VEKISGEDIACETSMSNIAFASCVGTAMTFYGFYIYGPASVLIFGAVCRLFSPASSVPTLIIPLTQHPQVRSFGPERR
jgi:hypothetical protein